MLHFYTKLFCFIFVLMTLAAPGFAQSNATYSSFKNIPELLKKDLKRGISLGSYIQKITQHITKQDLPGNNLTTQTLEQKKAYLEKESLQLQTQNFEYYDVNKDNHITSDEFEAQLAKRIKGKPHISMLRQITELDLDGNNLVTRNEYVSVNKQTERVVNSDLQYSNLKELIKLDPDQDGTLTIVELENLSVKAFNTVDLNKDKNISSKEYDIAIGAPNPASYTLHKNIKDVNVGTCFPKNQIGFPENIIVYGVAPSDIPPAYNGKNLNFSIETEKGVQAKQIDILVNETRAPVGLLLMNYEPTIWSITTTPGTKIHAVLTQGFYRHVISGLDQSTLQYPRSFQDNRKCRYYKDTKQKELRVINKFSNLFFRKPLDLFYPITETGNIIIGETNFDPSSLVRSSNNPPTSFKAGPVLIPQKPIKQPKPVKKKTNHKPSYNIKPIVSKKKLALEKASQQGLLRKTTPEEAKAFQNILIEQEKERPKLDIPLVYGRDQSEVIKTYLPKFNFENAYTVLKEFTFLDDLASSNQAALFIVPKGTPYPKGHPGKAKIFDFNTLECKYFKEHRERDCDKSRW